MWLETYSIHINNQDGNGTISKEELIEVLGGGDLVPLTEIDSIMQQADLNGDGQVEF